MHQSVFLIVLSNATYYSGYCSSGTQQVLNHLVSVVQWLHKVPLLLRVLQRHNHSHGNSAQVLGKIGLYFYLNGLNGSKSGDMYILS